MSELISSSTVYEQEQFMQGKRDQMTISFLDALGVTNQLQSLDNRKIEWLAKPYIDRHCRIKNISAREVD